MPDRPAPSLNHIDKVRYIEINPYDEIVIKVSFYGLRIIFQQFVPLSYCRQLLGKGSQKFCFMSSKGGES
jgi:hypothetical protein